MQQLEWLALHPDLPAAVRSAKAIADSTERLLAAAALSGYRRDFVVTAAIHRLAKEGLAREGLAQEGGARAGGLTPMRIALLGSHTLDHLVPSLCVAALQRRLAATVHVGAYGSYRQEILQEGGELEAFAPRMILFALDAGEFKLNLPLGAGREQVEPVVQARVDEIRRLWQRARARFGAQIVHQLLVEDDLPVFGSLDRLKPASPSSLTRRLNALLTQAAQEEGVLLLDLAPYAALFGAQDGLGDPVRWHQAKQLVSPSAAPLWGDLVARIAAAIVGRTRKVLVLDLDNTLWGGVVGDDGLHGLALGSGSALGEAFVGFQHYAASLAQRGILLAVCSKNDAAVAEEVFASHPDMVLKRHDIAAFVANWDDKATNLRRIAGTLNLGLDSLVFADDNPAERAIVRRELLEVAVPELPADPAHYARCIAQAGLFEAVSFTQEDADRGALYAVETRRAASLEQATDMDGYLRDLEMVLLAIPIGEAELPRATQLINKTNQFNLTTLRTTAEELRAVLAEPGSIGLAFRLKDRFGDNGLICVVLARQDAALPGDERLIHTWLMSCRVLKRGVEAAVLQALAGWAADRHVAALVGAYYPTGRNAMVSEHYAGLGFEPIGAPMPAGTDATFWRYEIGQSLPTHHIAVTTQP